MVFVYTCLRLERVLFNTEDRYTALSSATTQKERYMDDFILTYYCLPVDSVAPLPPALGGVVEGVDGWNGE